MSNRSRMPASARRGVIPQGRQGGKTTGFLTQLAEGIQQRGEEMENEEEQEDLNVLPMPEKQEIKSTSTANWIEWTWDLGLFKVIGILYTSDSTWTETPSPDKEKGVYEVQLSLPEEAYVRTFNPVESKLVGQALVSASNWINVWKDHAGMFLEKELMGE